MCLKRRFPGSGILANGLAAAVSLSLSLVVSSARGEITNEGPFTVFRTGGNESLLTLNLPLEIPDLSRAPELELHFGFATEEPDVAGEFFDSFSITLQKPDHSATALLLTADRTGVQWAPPNPGGLTLNSAEILRTEIAFPNLTPTLPFRFSYAIRFVLPPVLTGGPFTLFFDLFENLNQFASMAYISAVVVEPPVGPGPVFLQSSGSGAGPYADENGVAVDLTNGLVRFPRFSPMRFYRIQSDVRTRIVQFRIEEEELRFSYVFEPQTPVLQQAAAVGGPYQDELGGVVNAEEQTLRIPLPPGTRFFRIRSDGRARIVSLRAAVDQLIFKYEFVPSVLRLQSSPSPLGPYSDENGVLNDSANRTLRLNKFGQARFYRLRSDRAYQITSLQPGPTEMVLQFRKPREDLARNQSLKPSPAETP
jgi:hypothetical protein